MNQRSGRPAEKKFSYLCSQANISCNVSEEDDHGWDYIIEVPPPKQRKDIPLDKTPPVKTALVQVKSTNGQRATTRIKLTNAIKFASTALPCFVVLFQKTGIEEYKVFVQHFYSDLIERTLIRARKATVEQKEPNRLYLSISFSDKHEHTENNLVPWMISMIRNLKGDYQREKQELYNSIGYSDESEGYATMTLKLEDGIEEFIDLQLGLVDSVNFSNLEIIDERFGIEWADHEPQVREGKLSIEPISPSICSVIIQRPSGELLVFSGDVRVAQLPKSQAHQLKCLVKTESFSFLIEASGSCSATLDYHADKKFNLIDLEKHTKFYSLLGEDLAVRIVIEGLSDIPLSLPKNPIGIEEHSEDMNSIVSMLLKLQNLASTDVSKLSPIDIENSQNELLALRLLMSSDGKLFKMECPIQVEESMENISGYFDVRVGEYTFIVLFKAPIAYKTHKDDSSSVYFNNLVVAESILGMDDASVKESGADSYNLLKNRLGETCLDFGDLKLFFEK